MHDNELIIQCKQYDILCPEWIMVSVSVHFSLFKVCSVDDNYVWKKNHESFMPK